VAAAIAGVPPSTLKDVLVGRGWVVIDETENVWLLADGKDPRSEPVAIPKHGDVVDPEVMDSVSHRTGDLSRAVLDAVRNHVAAQTP